jgi:hypothetical protein
VSRSVSTASVTRALRGSSSKVFLSLSCRRSWDTAPPKSLMKSTRTSATTP